MEKRGQEFVLCTKVTSSFTHRSDHQTQNAVWGGGMGSWTLGPPPLHSIPVNQYDVDPYSECHYLKTFFFFKWYNLSFSCWDVCSSSERSKLRSSSKQKCYFTPKKLTGIRIPSTTAERPAHKHANVYHIEHARTHARTHNPQVYKFNSKSQKVLSCVLGNLNKCGVIRSCSCVHVFFMIALSLQLGFVLCSLELESSLDIEEYSQAFSFSWPSLFNPYST